MYLDIKNLVLQLIPLHKRQPNRYGWLCGLLSPLERHWQEFARWREDTRMLVNVNSQQMVLERFLRKQFNEESISVESFMDMLPFFPLSFESERHLQPMARSGEDLSGIDEAVRKTILEEIPLVNEKKESLEEDVDFIVRIPDSLAKEDVSAYVDKYRQALVRYMIVKQQEKID